MEVSTVGSVVCLLEHCAQPKKCRDSRGAALLNKGRKELLEAITAVVLQLRRIEINRNEGLDDGSESRDKAAIQASNFNDFTSIHNNNPSIFWFTTLFWINFFVVIRHHVNVLIVCTYSNLCPRTRLSTGCIPCLLLFLRPPR